MTHVLAYLAGIVTGAALLVVLGALRASDADAWRHNYRAECRRHDATMRRAAARERQAEIIILGLMESANQTDAPAPRCAWGDSVLDRFNWN